jgi:hypothetical protein
VRGFSLTITTSHLLADGRAFIFFLNSLAEMLCTSGGLSHEPWLDRSLLVPRSPPWYIPSLDAEFTRFTPETMINPLLAVAIKRRRYDIDAADLVDLQRAASRPAATAPRAL